MFADYGDLAGNSAEAVSKLEESSAQTNAVTQPMAQYKADGTHWRDPSGEYPAREPGRVSAGVVGSIIKTHMNI